MEGFGDLEDSLSLTAGIKPDGTGSTGNRRREIGNNELGVFLLSFLAKGQRKRSRT